MNPDKLTIDTVLHSRTTKNTVRIEDFQPAFQNEPRKWLVKGSWFNLAQLEARFTLPTERKGKKEAVA